jgi:3-keto-5-aminohexanoate cleavage enzyme
MSLRSEGKVMIEVGLNEGTLRHQNPNVAYTPDEIAADAIACAEAGASVIHWHARHDDGTQAWVGTDEYRRAMGTIAAACDVVVYPTYLGDLSHVWALADEPPAPGRLEVAPFDVFQEVGHVMWDARTDRLHPIVFGGREGEGPPCPTALAEMQRRGLAPSIAVFELGELRWAAHAKRLGLIEGPANLKLYVSEQWLKGPWPTPEGLEAFLAQWPADLDAELTVVPLFMFDDQRTRDLVRAGLAAGAHVRVGIGDNPDAHPMATNVELVRWAVGLVQGAGLTVATPDDVRARFGIGAPVS